MHDTTTPDISAIAQELYDLLGETFDGTVPKDWQARRNAALLRAHRAGLKTPGWLSDKFEMWD